MIDHVGITCSELPAAVAAYDRALGVRGHRRLMDFGESTATTSRRPVTPGPAMTNRDVDACGVS
jgi:catechol 2,3-dioxygenase-like lactoylglutathione lyase family enzyme